MSAIETAREAWGAELPDWVEVLALECDRTSQNKAAQRIGYAAAAVSTILRRKYGARTDAIEDTVRGCLMRETLACPALGDIGRDECRKWRRKAGAFQNVNSKHVMMYRACNHCPIHLDAREKEAS